jgi:vacuolar-type H+-ATPase subunit H
MDPTGDRPLDRDLRSQLAELLECERELDSRLRATQDEARRRVDEARAASSQAEAEMEAALEDEARRLRATIQSDAEARVREILDRSRERVARFQGVSDERVEALAESAFRRLIGIEDRS